MYIYYLHTSVDYKGANIYIKNFILNDSIFNKYACKIYILEDIQKKCIMTKLSVETESVHYKGTTAPIEVRMRDLDNE